MRYHPAGTPQDSPTTKPPSLKPHPKWGTFPICKKTDNVNCSFSEKFPFCLTHHQTKNGRKTIPSKARGFDS